MNEKQIMERVTKGENNIIRDLKEIDCEGNWKTLAQDRVRWRACVLAAMNLQVP